jgi:signal transduction histidine kinase
MQRMKRLQELANRIPIRWRLTLVSLGLLTLLLSALFDRFYRADPSRSRLPQLVGGNGLGLAIAKELVEAQGGAITIDSTPYEGTIVTIQLRAVPSLPHHATT